MAKDGKLGTFGGVFTPSLLTILGVIMYMRLPWIVGSGGLWVTLGIIAVAHVISVTTGLSISSIATDKNVGAGGPYYIVSRSLGLPIGGTLGLALFVGLGFSISLYIIGFCESFLAFVGLDVDPSTIRIAGTTTLLAITAITFISTAFAIKTQYFILAAIALSLSSVFLGGSDPGPAQPHLEAPAEAPPLGVLFAIFFPAVTGFTAGVNMSGDLRSPKRSIPIGTMTAIGCAAVVYVVLAAFLAYRVDPTALAGKSDVLTDVAFSPALVVAGIWGATLSSALGSILGAPRILQALSTDEITPRFFAKGHGKTNEPRRALLLAFMIGEGGILIAELDVIARVVTMIYLAMYGFLNISSAIESWASPDFRPAFRIPRLVSVIGAVTTIVVMIQLDFAAMAGAVALMAGLFLYLKRRQLTLDAGDTWEGIWSSIVRAGLHRLSQGKGQRRNWRPNVLAFSNRGSTVRPQLLEFSRALITGNGLLTDFELFEGGRAPPPATSDEPPPLGVFRRPTPSTDFYETVLTACRHHGFTGLDPNTILLDWDADRDEPARFVDLVRTCLALDRNVLFLHYDAERGWGKRRRIDIWWRPHQGNVLLSLALMRFMTRYEPWQGAQLRFLLGSEDAALSDDLHHAMRAVLAEARVEAKIKIVAIPSHARGFENAVRQESNDADLVVVGLPRSQLLDEKRLEALDELVRGLGTTLLLEGSSLFSEVLPVGGHAGASEALERAQTSATSMRPLYVPKSPELETSAASFGETYSKLADDLFRHGIAPVLARQETLVTDVAQLVSRQFEVVRKGVGSEAARARKPAGRAQGGFLFQARRLLATFEEEVLPNHVKSMRARLDAHADGLRRLATSGIKRVRVLGRPEQFEARDDDPPALRRYKRRRRFWAWVFRRPPRFEVPVAEIQRWYVESAALDVLEQTLRSVEASSHRIAVLLGKLLNEAGTELAALGAAIERKEVDNEAFEQRRQRLTGLLDAAVKMARDISDGTGARLAEQVHDLCDAFSHELERIDARRFAKRERRPPKKAAKRLDALRLSPERWGERQRLLLRRAQLGLQIAAFHHRFAVLAHKVKTEVAQQIRDSVLGEGTRLLESLQKFVQEAESGGAPKLAADRELRARFDANAALELLVRDVDGCIEDLPESATTLSDDAIAALEGGTTSDDEELNVSVRPLVKYLIETEFIDVVGQEIAGLAPQEQRTVTVAQDVRRLLAFTIGDLEALGGWENQDFRQQIVAVAREGASRLQRELDTLRSNLDSFVARVDQQLDALREDTAPYALTSRSDSLTHYIRSREGQRAVSWVRKLAARLSTGARTSFVALLYRRSSGALLARRLRRSAHGAIVTVGDRVMALAHVLTPRAEVLRSLPFYYRQLFSGQATISETFWVGRRAELERARAALKRHADGAHGALFVLGETGAGKTALCQAIVTKYLARRKVYRISPPPGGAVEPMAFRLALEAELEERGEPDELVGKIPDGSVLMFDDLELWWERSEEGLQVLEIFAQMVRRHGKRCLFIANLNVHAWRVISRFVRLDEAALAVIDCDPLPAEALKSIISLRHGSTGLGFVLGGTREQDLAPWRQARLFSRYFDFSGGLVAVALRAWLSNIEKLDGNTLFMKPPTRPDIDVLTELRIELRALLLQLVVHKQVTRRRLGRITALPEQELDADLGALVRMGIVRRDAHNVMHVDRFVAHFVTEGLRQSGMLQ